MSLRAYMHALMTDRRQGFGDALVKGVLWIFSLIYGRAVVFWRGLYIMGVLPRYQAPKPVICIGNITMGGSGKTPLTIAVAEALLQRQLRPAIVIRGYRAQNGNSDEATMLQERLPETPVLVGANRRQSIEDGRKRHAVDVFVCDDGFQHWPLQRNLDVVVVDGRNPFGNGQMIPRGILREPVSSLRRADIVVLTKVPQDRNQVDALRNQIQHLAPEALIVEGRHAVRGCANVFDNRPFDHGHLRGIRVVAFCGIGDPGFFGLCLQEAGLNVANMFVFSDHHPYTPSDMAQVRQWAQQHDVQVVITTHKDAVKLRRFHKEWQDFKLYYLHVDFELTYGKNVFLDRIMSAVRP